MFYEQPMFSLWGPVPLPRLSEPPRVAPYQSPLIEDVAVAQSSQGFRQQRGARPAKDQEEIRRKAVFGWHRIIGLLPGVFGVEKQLQGLSRADQLRSLGHTMRDCAPLTSSSRLVAIDLYHRWSMYHPARGIHLIMQHGLT